MILKKDKEITGFFYNGKPIIAIYRGIKLVWQAILSYSCYGPGIWENEKPWLENDAWKDEP